jgi:hypothetical protein
MFRKKIKDFDDPVKEYNFWMKKMARETDIAIKITAIVSTLSLVMLIVQLAIALLQIKGS